VSLVPYRDDPQREDPQVVYVDRRSFRCAPSCGCCLLGVLVVLGLCALFFWVVFEALGLV
jgi:hypothetical protein